MAFIWDPRKEKHVERKFDRLTKLICPDCGAEKYECAYCKTNICLNCYRTSDTHPCTA
jgi:hypothetical protein